MNVFYTSVLHSKSFYEFFDFILSSDMLEQHEKELAKYRSALSSSQEMWQSLQETTKKQVHSLISFMNLIVATTIRSKGRVRSK